MPRTSSTPKASSSGSSDVGDMSLVITQRSADLTHPDLIRGPASRARPSRLGLPQLCGTVLGASPLERAVAARQRPAVVCGAGATGAARAARLSTPLRNLLEPSSRSIRLQLHAPGSGPPKIDARILEPRHLAAAPHDAKPVGVSRPIAPEHPTARAHLWHTVAEPAGVSPLAYEEFGSSRWVSLTRSAGRVRARLL